MTQHLRIATTILVFLVTLCAGVFAGAYVLRHVRILPYIPHVSVWLDRVTLAVMVLGIPLLAALITYALLAQKRAQTGNDM